MEKIVKKALKTGYGLGLLTLAEGKKVAAKVKKDLGISEAESLRLARELVATSEKAAKEIMGTAEKHFNRAVTKSGLVKKSELAKVKKTLKKRVCGAMCKKEGFGSKIKRKVSRKKK
jgi:hypothetical protein